MVEIKELDYLYEQVNKIMLAMNTDETIAMINETDLLLKSLKNDFKEEKGLLTLESELEKIFSDRKKMREIKLNQKVKTEIETSIEYYATDRGTDERLYFQKTLEEELDNLKREIRIALSKIMSEKINEEINI